MDAAPGPQPISERVLRDGELRSLDWNKQRRSWEELRTALPPHSPRKELWIRRCRPHTKVSRREKTQGSLPAEDAALVHFFQRRVERPNQVAPDRRLAGNCRVVFQNSTVAP
jgi:hypothetical protein